LWVAQKKIGLIVKTTTSLPLRIEEDEVKGMLAIAVCSFVVVVLTAACEVANRDDLDGAPIEDALTIDGGELSDARAPRLSWGQAERILELSSPSAELSPSVSRAGPATTIARSELQGSVFRNVPFRAVRPNISASFGPAGRFEIAEGTSMFDLKMRDDELEVFFWSGLATLSFAERANTSSPFGDVTPLGVSGFSPSLAAGGLRLYYLTLEGELQVLRRATRASSWDTPASVGFEMSFEPSAIDVSDDELTLLVTAEDDSVYAGVYLSTRATTSESFGTPTRIASLEGPFANARFSPTEDVIVASAPFGGSDELYRSRLLP